MRYDPWKWAERFWTFLKKEATLQEQEQINTFLQENPELEDLRKELENKEKISDELVAFTSFDVEKALTNIHRHRSGRRRIVRLRYTGVAAAVLVMLGTAALWYTDRLPEVVEVPLENRAGGYARVILKTAGGQVYGLDTLSMAVRDEQKLAFDNRAGELNVKALAGEKTLPDTENNVVEVPYGGTYILRLQDSTKVYLNSGSRLEFPSRFDREERRVKVSGEVFFEVKHDAAWPFRVELEGGSIRVLGTSFNVKAYPEEHRIFTTLVEGKVTFAWKDRPEERLQPGQQISCYKTDGHTEIQKVDTRLYTAWKDGLFWFQDMPLEEILKIVARWFDLEVFYLNPEIKTTLFSGKMKMYSAVEDILRKFEQSDEIAFQLKGRTLTVYKK